MTASITGPRRALRSNDEDAEVAEGGCALGLLMLVALWVGIVWLIVRFG